MTLTIVLSGPAGVITQAKAALRNAGCEVLDTDHNWGLQGTPKSHAYVTVEGDDIDVAHSAVEPLNWCLRSHWNNEPAEPTDDLLPAQRLARIENDLAILRGML